jgi:hypothetical protein
MAHADQTPEAREGFAIYHILRVMAGEAKPTLHPRSFNLTDLQWARIEAQTEERVRKAAARILAEEYR